LDAVGAGLTFAARYKIVRKNCDLLLLVVAPVFLN